MNSPEPRGSVRTWWIAGLSVVLVALLITAVVLYLRDREAPSAATPIGWVPTPGSGSEASTIALRLQADGAGTGTVVISGVSGQTLPPTTTLPWSFAAAATVPDGTVKMEVRGHGRVSCTISVSGRAVAQDSGLHRARCAISRTRS
jgi:hypothetical protein